MRLRLAKEGLQVHRELETFLGSLRWAERMAAQDRICLVAGRELCNKGEIMVSKMGYLLESLLAR